MEPLIKQFFFCLSGTDEERGIRKWREKESTDDSAENTSGNHIYDLPFCQHFLDKFKIFHYLPICPRFSFGTLSRRKNAKRSYDLEHVERDGEVALNDVTENELTKGTNGV